MPLISFFEKTHRVTSAVAAPESQVLDVGLYYGTLVLELKLLGVESPGSNPSFKVVVETGLDPDGEDWHPLGQFLPLTAAKDKDKQTFTGLLRYVRWRVEAITDMGAATFTLAGVVR